MHRFWDWLGLNLGRHWILVMRRRRGSRRWFSASARPSSRSRPGRRTTSTRSDQVYKDNVAYQKLFGGEAMVALVTMAPGHKVAELFTPANIAQWQAVEREIRDSHRVLDVVSPLTALQWNDALVRSPSGDPTASVAGKIITGELQRDDVGHGQAGPARRRNQDLATPRRDPAVEAFDR